jgi:S-adenosylmethionine:tRNA ribosyltransferase-isomerase
MIWSKPVDRRSPRLLTIDIGGGIQDLARTALACLFSPGDLVIANHAATLPASLQGIHCTSGAPIEVRLAAWVAIGDPTRFAAIAFGAGDHRTRTEDRMLPPSVSPGDRLTLGPLGAIIEHPLGDRRLFRLRFLGDRATILAGLARHGRPIQYAHVSEPLVLRDVWTTIAADPIAFEPPSAGFALDWHTQAVWRQRGIGFATLAHAAGISSTGEPVLDLRLPFDEPYRIHEHTAAAIKRAKSNDRRIIAIGTTVVRALESAANPDGSVRVGDGVASGRIGRETPLRVVDAMLTGVHQPGESHFELLRAFANDALLDQISEAFDQRGYRLHEFGDSMLIERCRHSARQDPTTSDQQRRGDRQCQRAPDNFHEPTWGHARAGHRERDPRRPKIAALVADAFQEEEYFFPRSPSMRLATGSRWCPHARSRSRFTATSREPACWTSSVRSWKPAPRTMSASSFQVVQKAQPCLPKIRV